MKFPKLPLYFWSPALISRIASTLGVPLYMDEATATGSRVDFARICVEIDVVFSFPQTTHLEVNGSQEDIHVDYDWEPHPCAMCSSFNHEEGSCSTVVSTLATMEVTAPATVSLV